MKEYLNDAGDVLHCIYRLDDCDTDRQDFTSEDKFLQCAVMRMNSGKTFRNHKHIKCERNIDMTQESWVVIRGSIQVDYYDESEHLVGTEVINAGDCTVTFRGGHKLSCISDDTLIYEFKNGPYFGREADKEFIDE